MGTGVMEKMEVEDMAGAIATVGVSLVGVMSMEQLQVSRA